MSLINEALKRAKEAQEQAPQPSTPGPQLRPVEARSGGTRGMLAPLTIAVLAIGIVVLGWQMFRNRVSGRVRPAGTTELVAQAKAPPAPIAPAAPTPAAVVDPAPAEAAGLQASTPNPASTPAAPEMVEASESAPETPETAPAKPAEPAPLRLQGIMSHPTRPSALINGKTLFVGDRFRGLQLKVIRGSSVTLSGPEGTIVLTLH